MPTSRNIKLSNLKFDPADPQKIDSPQLVTFALAAALKDGCTSITITKEQDGNWTLKGT
jgi:hypothetical protein